MIIYCMSERMTKAELIAELKILVNGYSPEENHMEADELLLSYINDAEITEAYRLIKKWYS